MTEDARLDLAKKATCEMFSTDVGYHRVSNIIRHYLSSLPQTEVPYEQARFYRKLVGLE